HDLLHARVFRGGHLLQHGIGDVLGRVFAHGYSPLGADLAGWRKTWLLALIVRAGLVIFNSESGAANNDLDRRRWRAAAPRQVGSIPRKQERHEGLGLAGWHA